LAAAAVFIHHAEQFKQFARLPSNYHNRWIHSFGLQGVNLFFVLSGFLITYLLAAELKQAGRISILHFWFRRACRILPLYYLAVALGLTMLLIVWPVSDTAGGIDQFVETKRQEAMEHLKPILGLYLFLLPNLVTPPFNFVLFVSQAWSIGVEEQFYLVWPWILKFIPPVRWVHAFIAVIVVKLVATGMAENLLVRSYLFYARFEDMAIGGIGGWLLFYHKDFVKEHLVSRWLQPIAGPALIVVMGYGATLDSMAQLLAPCCYMILLLNVTTSPYRYVNLETKPLNFLGKISYGLYMYHILAIMISLRFVTLYASSEPSATWLEWFGVNVPYYTLSAVTTIGLAAGSYRFYESHFLKLKDRFGSLSSDQAPARPDLSAERGCNPGADAAYAPGSP
jgi:peptidoglycan/LPS O-acetylase OafA/YrhL